VTEYFISKEDFAVGNVVGYIKNGDIYLVKHLNFNIFYNKKTEVVEVVK
jgi:hypothetical protein